MATHTEIGDGGGTPVRDTLSVFHDGVEITSGWHGALPHRCAGCPARWNGERTAHCASCHVTFTSPAAFDAHRVRPGGRKGVPVQIGECQHPADVGQFEHGRAGYSAWGGKPMSADARAAMGWTE